MSWRIWLLLVGICCQLGLLELSIFGGYPVPVQALIAALVVHAAYLLTRQWRREHPQEEDPDEQ